LDYFNGSHPKKRVSVAIAKLPAKIPVADKRYGGPILLNPGGPGGPGAQFALSAAKSIQYIVDATSDPASAGKDARFFDIIGFDPRGIGETEPLAKCISDPAAAWSWRLREIEEGILGSSDAALGRLWAMSHAFGSSCALAKGGEDDPDIKQYVATAFVAQDMLQIVEKHAEYVAEQVLQATRDNSRQLVDCDSSDASPVSAEAKLQYWGFSYGTLLGSTFASMFPNRIGRVVLDGVVNDWDYKHSLGKGSLRDNERAMEAFYSYCLLSGPQVCPLAENNATSTVKIKERTQKIVRSLYHSPLSLTSAEGPGIITYSDVKSIIFSIIYQPLLGFELLGRLLSQIEIGHGEYIDWLSESTRHGHTLSCGVNGTVNPGIHAVDDVPTYAVLCSDGVDQQNIGLDDFVELWHGMQNISTAAGDVWAMLGMKCANWKIRASYKFDGPFGGNTSHPILFVSNTADPVTPLRSGRVMSSKFSESGLLINDQAGHCSFSDKNLCAFGKIKQYFQTGSLPASKTLCVPPPSAYSLNSTDPDSPFYDPTLDSYRSEPAEFEYTFEQQNMHDAVQTLRRVMAETGAFTFNGLIGNVKSRQVQRLALSKFRE
jgi:pimeloyl-ACP methyl ester carboxylesterase